MKTDKEILHEIIVTKHMIQTKQHTLSKYTPEMMMQDNHAMHAVLLDKEISELEMRMFALLWVLK